MSPIQPRLSILLPVRNEGINLKIMLKILETMVEIPHEVLVIHDDLVDESIAVAQELMKVYSNVRLIQNTLGRGVINAVRCGVEKAEGEFILIFAADEVGPVLVVNEMVDLILHKADFVSSTRYAHGGRRLGGSFIGGILSMLANKIFMVLTKNRLSDCTTGIKLFRKADFNKFNLESNPVGWAFAFEMAIKAQLLGMRLGEIPIVSIDRLYGGKSTFKLGSWSKEYFRWLLWGILKMNRLSSFKPSSLEVKIPDMINR